MPARILILLTTDSRLVEIVSESLPGHDVRTVRCLRGLPEPNRSDRLIIDPRAVERCCVEGLHAWRRRVSPERIHFLSLPAAPEVLLTLGQIAHGTVTRLDEIPALAASESGQSRASLAWANRQRILSLEGRPKKARLFLHLARMHSRDRYSVPEAAFDLGLHVRRLTRLSIEWFEYTPGLVISLSRITNLAEEIAATTTLLRVLAKSFGFRDQAAMAREFSRFAGAPPSIYREFHRARRLSEIAKPTSETAG